MLKCCCVFRWFGQCLFVSTRDETYLVYVSVAVMACSYHMMYILGPDLQLSTDADRHQVRRRRSRLNNLAVAGLEGLKDKT